MAEAAVDVIGSPPADNSNTRWGFPEEEARDVAARIFGTHFDVTYPSMVSSNTDVTTNKFNIIKDKHGHE